MYPRILQKVFSEPWCVTVEQHQAIQRALEAMVLGQEMSEQGNIPIRNQFYAAGLGLSAPKDRASRVYTRGQLAYIPVHGIIGKGLSGLEMMCGGYSLEQLTSDLDTALADSSIFRILMDFNSPGGTATGVLEAARVVLEAGRSKETFAFTDTQSASASYWLMSQANYVLATESSSVGSIGVYLALLDRSEELTQRGVKLKLFKAGKHKGLGLPGNPLTEEDEKLLQAGVDKIYAQFTEAVTAKRPQVKESAMQGQVFLGADARKAGLIESTVAHLPSLVKRLA